MTLTPQEMVLRLADLVRRMPNLKAGPITQDMNDWIANATALVELGGDMFDTTAIKVASQFFDGVNRVHNAQQIEIVLKHTLAKMQLRLPPGAAPGTILAVGQPLSNLAAVTDVLATAKTDVFVVDAYVDGTVVTKFLGFAKEGVTLRLLGDRDKKQPSLLPALVDWSKEYGPRRPLEGRYSPKGALHNRDIIIDRAQVWRLGQSLKDLAARSPDALERMADHLAPDEIKHYEALWTTSTVVS